MHLFLRVFTSLTGKAVSSLQYVLPVTFSIVLNAVASEVAVLRSQGHSCKPQVQFPTCSGSGCLHGWSSSRAATDAADLEAQAGNAGQADTESAVLPY